MKYSNRFLGFLLLFVILGLFYIFYSFYFKINTVNLKIISNIGGFSGSLTNIKFNKDFYCKDKTCLIEKIPPFEYNIFLKKEAYKSYSSKINLSQTGVLNVVFEKKFVLKELDNKNKKITKKALIEKIKERKRSNLLYLGEKYKYNKIINNDRFGYLNIDKKIVFYNFSNSNTFEIEFFPKVNYVKYIGNNIFVINTDVGSFNFNYLSKKIDYFSLFFDYIIKDDYYVGVIQNNDLIRKKNFGLEDISGDLLVLYNIKNKKYELLDNFLLHIRKIYLKDGKGFIELDNKKIIQIKNI